MRSWVSMHEIVFDTNEIEVCSARESLQGSSMETVALYEGGLWITWDML